MTKHRAVVTGWDPAKVNPDGSTGRPKGVQTAADMRIMTTFDVLGEGIFAAKGIPAITGSPTNSASISPFMAAIAAPAGGFYIVSIDAPENFTINMANVGAVKVYVQQEDYQVDNTKVDSNVVIGVVYGANPIPANSLLLFTTTITAQTSTNGLTFTPAFKYTGNLSGLVRVPTQADLANIAVITTGMRALVTTAGGGGTAGEYFYNGSSWTLTTIANPALDSLLANGYLPMSETLTFSSYNATTRIGVVGGLTNATAKYSRGMWIRISQPSGTKWGMITAVSSTQLTINMLSGVLANETITTPFYSFAAAPNGAPSLPVTWTEGNGWTVWDYGTERLIFRTNTFASTVLAGGAFGYRSSGISYPVGYGAQTMGAGRVATSDQALGATFDYLTGSTVVQFDTSNQYTGGSVTPQFNWYLEVKAQV